MLCVIFKAASQSVNLFCKISKVTVVSELIRECSALVAK